MVDGGADAEPLPGLDEVPDDDVLDLCPCSDFFEIDRVSDPGIEQIEIPEDTEERALGKDLQIPGLGEIADQEIRQSVSPEIEISRHPCCS